MDLLFKVEYTPTNVKDNCIKCHKQFIASELRIAQLVQSNLHDGKDPLWFHNQCFFDNHQPKFADQIENFEGIKYDDQLDILARMDPTFAIIAKKRAAQEPPDPAAITNYGIEYSTSNDDACHVCSEPICRNELRIKKIVFDTDIGVQFGKEILWNHLHCFIFNRDMYAFKFSGEILPGFEGLQPAHKEIIKEALPSFATDDEVVHMMKQIKVQDNQVNDNLQVTDEDPEATIANQTAELVRVRQALQKVCSIEELQFLLLMNESDVSENLDSLLDRCADILTFGALYKCQKCFRGDMMFTKHGYTCNGLVDDWVMCGKFEVKPMRLKCLIPDELKQKNFFATCEPVVQHRAVRSLVHEVHETNAQTNLVEAPRSSGNNKVTHIKLKNGTAVDPNSGLDAISHVYNSKGVLYTSVLALTDIQKNKNSYFKLQVLESDNDQTRKSFWLFTSWGRIGTDIGDSKVQAFTSSALACAEFEKIFMEQTDNEWNSANGFKKKPGKFYQIDVNYSDDVTMNTATASRLSREVEELMKLLFNVKTMTNAMREFQLDLEKMPLGKLSVKQLQAAYFALVELEDSINSDSSQLELLGLSNKFYTLIPHNFGLGKAPIIDTFEKINAKREMVDSLLDIEGAYAIMTQILPCKDMNSFDAYYMQLKADVTVLDRNGEEFRLIDLYTQNTSVHGYKIELLEVFKVSRHGEKQRYEQIKLLNRRLLWHGSRLTNFVSILANGLQICPQVNGSMFGRGLYFADMISKSVAYCTPAPPENIALLALCEVALGNIQQGYHNMAADSVQGAGATQPDPAQAHIRVDGSIIPLGKPIQAPGNGLAFNEFIVYNEAQVNIQYLVKVKTG